MACQPLLLWRAERCGSVRGELAGGFEHLTGEVEALPSWVPGTYSDLSKTVGSIFAALLEGR
jgi:hypothetical protein